MAITAGAEVPYTPESIAKGRAAYLLYCTQCHGNDGKSQVDVVSNATDLTEPTLYHSGTSDAEIDRSIREGVNGVMPAWGSALTDAETIGHMRNYIKSLWPAAQRPKGQ